jgi:hypothetical protein
MSAIELFSGFPWKEMAALLIPPELPAVIKSLHNSKGSATRVLASTTTIAAEHFRNPKALRKLDRACSAQIALLLFLSHYGRYGGLFRPKP